MTIITQGTNPAALAFARRQSFTSGGSSIGRFVLRRAGYVQVARGQAGAFRARGVVQ